MKTTLTALATCAHCRAPHVQTNIDDFGLDDTALEALGDGSFCEACLAEAEQHAEPETHLSRCGAVWLPNADCPVCETIDAGGI